MAISRQLNLISQERLDVPFLRGIESASCNDWDVAGGSMIAGGQPLVINGLHVITTGITQAQALILQVADSIFLNLNATASGSVFHIPNSEPDQVLSNSNPNIVGGWVNNSVNYVGLDITRAPDSSTSDLVEIIDTNELVEDPITAPLGVLTHYSIVITNIDFDSNPNVCPIAKVVVDAAGGITSIQDCRNFLFRLGSGGTVPNNTFSYSWPGGRKEVTSGDIFSGTDKNINSLKAFAQAIATRAWELGGGENWYSPTADRNIRLATSGTAFVSNGMYFEFVGGNLHWKGLTLLFDNSTATSNQIADQTTNVAGLTDLVSGECIYVDVDRTTNRSGGTSLVAQKGVLATLGTPTIPGSRWVLAWNFSGSIFIRDQVFAVGSSFISATVSASGTVKLSASDSNSVSPAHVATVDSTTFQARAAGISRGFHNPAVTPSTSDFIGSSGDIIIGGGFDGADGHGGGNAVDFNIFLNTIRAQDTIYSYGAGGFVSNGAATTTIISPVLSGSALAGQVMARYASGNPGGMNSVFHIYGDGSLGFVNNLDANPSGGGVPTTPTPTTNLEVRTKVFTKSNGLTTPHQRDQTCLMQWDGSIVVISESAPY